MQHIHIVNKCRSSTLAPNIRGVLQHSTLAVPNERSNSRQAANNRDVLQCSTFTLSNKDVVQHKRQIQEVFCKAAHPVAILKGGLGGPCPPDFCLDSVWPRCFFLNFPFKFVWLTYAGLPIAFCKNTGHFANSARSELCGNS